MTLRDVLRVILKRIWIVALVCVLFGGGAVGLSLLQTPRYQAAVTVLIGQGEGITQSPNEALGLQQLTQTMATAADSPRIYEPVIEEFNLDMTPGEFEDRFSVQQVSASQFVEISYTDTDPEETRQIVNALGEEFSEQIDDVNSDSNQVTATVWNMADTPTEPVSPNPMRNGILALFFGGILGVGVAFLLEFFDDSWSSPEEAEQISGVPTFGMIPDFSTASKRQSAARSGRKKKKPSGHDSHDAQQRIREKTPGAPRTSANSVGGVDHLPFGVFSMSADGRLVQSNAALREMLGFSGAAGDGFVPELASHEDDVDEHARLNEEIISGATDDYQLEKRLVKKDGGEIWVRVTVSRNTDEGDVVDAPFTGMMQEITAQRRDQERLKLSEAGLRAVLDTSPSLSVYSFTVEGEITVGREEWGKLWGGDEAKSSGNVFQDDRAKEVGLTDFIAQSIEATTPITTPPIEISHRDAFENARNGSHAVNGSGYIRSERSNGDGGHLENGEECWIMARINPVSDGDSGIREVWMAIEDVTSEKKSERRLQSARREREEMSEMLQKTEAEREKSERNLKEFRESFKGLMDSINDAPRNDELRKDETR